MVFRSINIRALYWLVIMAASAAILVSVICSTWVMHNAYLKGLVKNPELNGVYIEMRENWYPEMTSESGLGKFFSRSSSDKYPETKEYPMAIYRKADGCSNLGRLVVTKLPKETQAMLQADKKITSQKRYSWGLAEIVTESGDKPAENALSNTQKRVVLVREYGLFITVDNLSFLDDIVSISE